MNLDKKVEFALEGYCDGIDWLNVPVAEEGEAAASIENLPTEILLFIKERLSAFIAENSGDVDVYAANFGCGLEHALYNIGFELHMICQERTMEMQIEPESIISKRLFSAASRLPAIDYDELLMPA